MNWFKDHNRFLNVVIPKIRSIGLEIGKAAEKGNKVAIEIIQYYKMLRISFDPMTLCLLEEKLEEWEKS